MKRLDTQAQVDLAVDELLVSFTIPQKKKPKLQEFDDSAPRKTVKNGESAFGDEQNIEIKTVSPNPFVDNFKVSFFSKNAAVVNFSLMSSSGQLVAQEKIQAEEGINTYEFTDKYNLKKGIYYLTIFYNEQKALRKIIKN